jgi:hypothetical protein
MSSENMHIACNNPKSNLLVTEYMSKMRSLVDDILASQLKMRFSIDFNPIVTIMATRIEPKSIGELFTQSLSFESHMNLLQGGAHGSTNMSYRGCDKTGTSSCGHCAPYGCSGGPRGHELLPRT